MITHLKGIILRLEEINDIFIILRETRLCNVEKYIHTQKIGYSRHNQHAGSADHPIFFRVHTIEIPELRVHSITSSTSYFIHVCPIQCVRIKFTSNHLKFNEPV